ncbi:MAG: translation initiation factor IF-3 [Planctomycetes bacterium]|nr:translation initiation factor IF-3 [Planctomycetota bacterium]
MSKQGLKVNGGIKARQVRLINEKNEQVGVVDRYEALRVSQDAGLDLVEVSPNGDPPVCRVMDYGKWLYEQKRKAREAHKKTRSTSQVLKEIRLRPETDPHDLGIKLKKARQFLEKGYKVQITVFFRGRQMLHRDRGFEILKNIAETMEDCSKVERPSKMAGRRMTLLLGAK